MSHAPPPLENDQEVIEWMLFQNLDKREWEEFSTQLQEFRRRTESGDTNAREEFGEWWTSWMVSIRLHVDSEYQRQGKESLARQRSGDVGTPVDSKELRGRLQA